MSYIYIGFSYPNKFKIGAWLLRVWQKSDYSHTYIRFDSEKIESTVYHAAHGMVHFKTYENFIKENNIIQEFKIDCDKYTCLKHCIKLAGQDYSKLELLKIALYDIFMNIGIKLKFQDDAGYICSELVGEIAKKELKLRFEKPTFLLTPKDIWIALMEN